MVASCCQLTSVPAEDERMPTVLGLVPRRDMAENIYPPASPSSLSQPLSKVPVMA